MAQLFNACEYLLDRRLSAGDAPRTALTGGAGDLSYAGCTTRCAGPRPDCDRSGCSPSSGS